MSRTILTDSNDDCEERLVTKSFGFFIFESLIIYSNFKAHRFCINHISNAPGRIMYAFGWCCPSATFASQQKIILCKTTTLHVQHILLHITLPSLYDCDVKLPSSRFLDRREQTTTKFSLFLLLWTWIWFLGIQLQKSSLALGKVGELENSR